MSAPLENFLAIVVCQKLAQNARRIIEKHRIWDDSRTLMKVDADKIAIPIKTDMMNTLTQLSENQIFDFEFTVERKTLPASKKTTLVTPYEKMLKCVKALTAETGLELPDNVWNEIPNNWEKHGDLILLPEHAFNNDLWNNLGISLWTTVACALSCSRIGKKSAVSTDSYRHPQVTLLLGSDGLVEHVDNNIRYSYDVTKCMFSAGNITEKLRIACFDCSEETVVDLYAGIGYFTLPYLVHANAKHVHACEWNPDAVKALKKNLELNGVLEKCTVYCGDNRQVCPKGLADRVNLGLIPSSEEGWCVACAALKFSGGVLHIHQNVTTKNSKYSGSETVKEQWNKWGWKTRIKIQNYLQELHGDEWNVTVAHIEHIKSYAPHVDHLVLDLECRPIK